MFRLRLFAAVVAISLSSKAAIAETDGAEIDLGTWRTHAAMAEQGAVCGAFADLMAMQSLVDEKVGRLWSERRAYSGSVIKRAAELEGRDDVNNNAVDTLLNRYSMWLLNNLANPANAEILDPVARNAASDMIGDVCAGLYAQADRAILKKHPSLAACSPGQAPLPKLSGAAEDKPAACEGDSAILAATTIKQAEDAVADTLRRLQKAQARADDLSDEIAILQIDNDRLLREIDANRIVSTKVDDLTGDGDHLRGEITKLQKDLAARIEANARLDADISNLQVRHEEALTKVDDLIGTLAAARSAIIAAPTSDDFADKIAELATTRDTLRDITAERDSLTRELAMATATLETMTGTMLSSQDKQPANSDSAVVAPNTLALLDTDMTSTAGPETASAMPAPAIAPDKTPEQRLPKQRLPDQRPVAATSQDIGTTTPKSFVAQLGAFRSRTGALTEISRIQTDFPGKSALASLTITPLRRDDGSSIFRITTSRMLAEDAQRLCGELWDSMVSCMLRAAP